MPKRKWAYYQEWNHSLFLHWKIPSDILKPNLPRGLDLDTFDEKSWVSLVAFTMEKIRPRGLPAIPYISDFHELNLRTYVTAEGKPGVYFLHISAQKELSVWLAKLLSGLPYERSTISRLQQDDYQTYSLLHSIKPFKLNAEFRVADPIEVKSPLDFWLTERYCLYVEHGNSLFRYDVHHAPWQLKNIHLLHLTMDGLPGNIVLDRMPDLAHYSRGVKVLAWQKSSVIRQPR